LSTLRSGEFNDVTERIMKIVTGSIAASAFRLTFRPTLLAALMAGAVGAAYAQQSDSSGVSGSNGLQQGVTNSTGLTPGASPGPVPGMGPAGIPGAASPAPALNNMRANGTSLNMSPDPRAPNVTGRPAPLR
jgi:hypothetical protein